MPRLRSLAVPLAAFFTAGNPGFGQIVFSENVVEDVTPDLSNWELHANGSPWNLVGGAYNNNFFDFDADEDVGGNGPDRISYRTTPADLFTLASGLPVRRFIDFPVTVS